MIRPSNSVDYNGGGFKHKPMIVSLKCKVIQLNKYLSYLKI